MAEVIDLISSPETCRKERSALGQHSNSRSIAKDIFCYSSDDFNVSGLIDEPQFSLSHASKRRKLSPPRNVEGGASSMSRPTDTEVYVISDDDDLQLPDFGPKISRACLSSIRSLEQIGSDTITFTSPASMLRATGQGRLNVSSLHEGFFDEILSDRENMTITKPIPSVNDQMQLSNRTTSLLAAIENNKSLATKPRAKRIKNGYENVDSAFIDEIVSSSPVDPLIQACKVQQNKGPRRIGVDREATKAAKDREKEEEKERKRLLREQKTKERQQATDLAQVNKSKMDRKESVTEMILEISASLRRSSVGNQVEEYMKHLGVAVRSFEDEVDLQEDTLQETNIAGNLVKWRRKLCAAYNEDAGQWEPLKIPRIEKEPHLLVQLTATEFMELAASGCEIPAEVDDMDLGPMVKNLDIHVAILRRMHKDCKPIYLIEGLTTFLRKNKTAKNRAYTAAVLSQIPPPNESSNSPPPAQPRRRKKATSSAADYSYVNSTLVESLLLHLQLHHSVLIHHTTTPSNTAEWIRNFTEHISTIPYRRSRMALNDAGAAFCMDVGQVKTGDDAADTYIKMLQEIQRVTPAMAYGIANRYPTVQLLSRAFREHGPLVLQDVRKGANKDGALTDSRLGPAVSRRLYKVFTGTDEWSQDGIA